MRVFFLLYACVSSAASCGSPSGGKGPQDSPVESLYGADSFVWAQNLVPWSCVYSVADYNGSDDEKFAFAQKDAAANGGGVVFFPGGSYTFTANLTLASGIVIRGEVSTAAAKTGKTVGPLAQSLKTKFSCPNRAHIGIWNSDPKATNLGIVRISSPMPTYHLSPTGLHIVMTPKCLHAG